MEDIYNDLLQLGFDVDHVDISQAFNDGPPNIHLVDIVAWLSSQLSPLCDLENHISPVTDEDELDAKAIGFLVEVSSLLKELCCPIKTLTRGPLEERLHGRGDKMIAVTYLCRELEAGKILALKKPKKKEPALKIELSESKTAKELREMLISLSFGKPPDNITPQKLFTEVEKKLRSLSQSLSPKDLVGELLFSGYLTEKQWFQLENLYQEINQEYKTRRNLLLTRLDVTVQSFLWSDRLKVKSEEINNNYNKQRKVIFDDPSVKISDVLSATANLAIVEKTSSALVRKNTKSSVNKVIIGAVPDRGGRPEEQQPPPPEVPSWQKNDSSSRGGMRQMSQASNSYKNMGDRGTQNFSSRDNYSRGGHNDSRGGYNDNRGGYNDSRSGYNDSRGGYNDSRGGYNDNRSGYNDNRGGYNENRRGFSDNRGGYDRKRGDHNQPSFQPVYQPVQYYAQQGNPQFGFGGYTPAGDNFQQFGMTEGVNQYQSRANSGSDNRQRGGYGGERGSRPYRGQGRGRGGRW